MKKIIISSSIVLLLVFLTNKIFAQVPANDNCSGATLLTVGASCTYTSGTSLNATQNIVGCTGTADDDVWYKFVANNSFQTITLLPSAGYDPVLQLFSAPATNPCASLVSISCKDDSVLGEREVIDALGLTIGATYYIRVYDWYIGSGSNTFQICIKGTAAGGGAPTNDNPCSAIPLPPATSGCEYHTFTTVSATQTTGAGIPTPSSCAGGVSSTTGGWAATSKDVWFTVEVPASGKLEIKAKPQWDGSVSVSDGVMAVYSGTCTSMTQIACSDKYVRSHFPDQPMILLSGQTPGAILYIRFWAFGSGSGTFGICASSPTNDACTDALYICNLNGYQGTTSAAYTIDMPGNMCDYNTNPDNSCTLWPGVNTVIDNNSWIEFTANNTTAVLNVTVSDCWTDPNYAYNHGIQMRIFEGTNCNNFVPVSSLLDGVTNTGTITATSLTYGKTYYLMIDGFGGDVCNYTISANSGVQFPEIKAENSIFCQGGNTILNGPDGAISYYWLHNGATTQAVTVNPTVTTTYTLYAFGVCNEKQTLSTTITVLPSLANNSITANQTICSGKIPSQLVGSTPTGGSGTYSYRWISSTTSATSGFATASGSSAAKNYQPAALTQTIWYRRIISSEQCTGSFADTTSAIKITINTLPTANAGSDAEICSGLSTNLGASGGTSYSWSPSTGLSATNVSNPTANPVVTTTYTVVVTDANTCSATNDMVLTVRSKPTANAGSAAAVCTGNSTSLGASGGNTYIWDPSTGLSATNIYNPTATPTATTTYTVQATSTYGCTDTDQVIITVNPLPVTPTSIGLDRNNICADDAGTVTLTASGGSGTTLRWFTGSCAGTDIGTGNPMTVNSPTSTTTYYVRWENGCGNSTCQTTDITINQLPTANAGVDFSIPYGTPSTINGSASGGSGSYSFAWAPAVSLVASNVQNPTTTNLTSTTIFTVTVTDQVSGCKNTDLVTVSITGGPLSVSISPASATICKNNSTQITANASGGSNNFTYLWSPAGTLSAGNIVNPEASPTTTTTYTVTVNDGFNTATSSIVVTVNQLPVASAGSDIGICSGASTNLNASGGTVYSWSPASDLNNTLISNPVASPTSQTTYTVTVTDVNGCSASDNMVLSINTSPTANAGTNDSICLGKSIQLGATGGNTYNWSPTTGLNSTNIYNPIASPANTTTYTVQVTDGNGCTATDNMVVIIRTLPAAYAGVDKAICSGASVQLAASGGTTYQWSPSTGLNNVNSQTPTAGPLGNMTYTVTVTDGNGCSASDDVAVAVNSLPTANAGSNTSVCSGNSIQLNASGGTSYSWSPSTGLNATNVSNPTATPNTTTTYTAIVTDANGCSASDDIIVTINPLPEAPTLIVPDRNNLCADDAGTLSLLANGGSGTTIRWYTGSCGGTNIGTGNPMVVNSPTSTTTYFVRWENGCGNSVCQTVAVNINQLPAPNAGADFSIPNGTSTTLNGSASGGSGTFSYNWSPSASLVSSNVQSPSTTNLTSNTLYTLTITDLVTGCQSTDQVTITVTGGPLSVSTNAVTSNICRNNSTQITANPSGGSGSYIYTWSPTTNLTSNTSINPTASPITTTTYTVTVDDGFNTATSSVVVSVNQLPTANAGSDAGICNGSSTNLNASGGISYSWSPSFGLSNTLISNPTASPTTDMVYTVTVTDANGCTASDNVSLSVYPLPTANAGNDLSICAGNSTMLNATGGGQYNWSPASGLNSTTISSPTASPVSSTTYTLMVTNGNGCTYTDDIIVNVWTLPVAYAGVDKTICNGNTAQLSATGGNAYQWSPLTGLNSTISPTPTASPTSSVTYTVSVTDANGCSSSDDVIVNVNTLPTANAGSNTQICSGDLTQLNATGGTSYLWSPSTALNASNISNPTSNPTTSTTYTVAVTDANGCSASDNVVVSVNPLPVVNAGNNFSILNGTNTTLNGTVTGGSGLYTYSWAPASLLTSANNIQSPVTVNLTSPTIYTLTVTDNVSGCHNTDQVLVSISGSVLNASASAGPAAICGGNTTTLSTIVTGGSGSYTYSWSSIPVGNPVWSSTLVNPVVSPTINTAYTVTVNDGFNTTTATSVVTVYTVPNANAGNDVAICSGNNTTLFASGGSTYTWNNGINIQSNTVNPLVNTTYTVTATNANGCSNSDNVVVTVNTLPDANTGSPQFTCAGYPVTIGADSVNGSTYFWSSTPAGFTSTISSPSVSPTINTTYTLVEIITATGCSKMKAVVISIYQNPNANAGADAAICFGASTQLNATGGSSYLWSPSTGLDATISPTPTASPTSSVTYTVSVTDANGCTASDVVVVNVNSLPTIFAGNDTSVCNGTAITLVGTGASSYSWNNGITNDVSFVPSASNTYIVTGTDINGCSNTDTVVVNVNSLPIANAGSDASICMSDNTQLNATGGTSYLWSPSNGLSGTNLYNPIANPTITTTYTVAVSNANNCSAIDNIVVIVNPLPTPNAGSDIEICLGARSEISASGGSSYLWSPSTGLSQINIANPTANPTVTTTYVLTVTNSFNCFATDDLIITVNPLPLANAGDDKTICSGMETQLNANGGITYHWSNGSTNAITTVKTIETTTFTVTVTDTKGCSSTDNATIIVIKSPEIDLTLQQDTFPIYVGQLLTFLVSPSGYNNYEFLVDGQQAQIGTAETYATNSLNDNSEVWVIATNNTCKSNADSIIIHIKPLSNAFTPDGDGKNDLFLKGMDLTIMNRWGQKMYEGVDGWNGKYNGQKASPGTYFYLVKIKDKDGNSSTVTGSVNLVGKTN